MPEQEVLDTVDKEMSGMEFEKLTGVGCHVYFCTLTGESDAYGTLNYCKRGIGL